VRAVKRKGSAVSPYAVCTAALRKNPDAPIIFEIRPSTSSYGRWVVFGGPTPKYFWHKREAELYVEKETHKKNPAYRPDVDAAIAEAQKRFKSFTGREATTLDRVRVSQPKVALTVGLLDGVPYTTIREGKVMQYMHWFKKRARPLLAVSSDGRSISIVGGRFRFTDAGFVDET